jgi:hypothetical protein
MIKRLKKVFFELNIPLSFYIKDFKAKDEGFFGL